MTKRTTISNGIRWFRHPIAPIAILFLANVFQGPGWQANLAAFLFLVIVYLLLWISRRIRFDEESFIIINGNRERLIPFTQIESVKRSARKVNGTKMWYIEYKDKDDQIHKKYFLEGSFQHGSVKEFIKGVEKINPSVLVWDHPFFNHPEEKKDESE